MIFNFLVCFPLIDEDCLPPSFLSLFLKADERSSSIGVLSLKF